MCNVAALGVMAGGTILSTLGQKRALRAQQRVAEAAADAAAAANERRILDLVDTANEIGDAQSTPLDISRSLQAINELGIDVRGGGIASLLAQAESEALSEREHRVRGAERDALGRSNLEGRQLARDLELDLRTHDADMRVAGTKGMAMRQVGQTLTTMGQGALSYNANQPAGPTRQELDLKVLREQKAGAVSPQTAREYRSSLDFSGDHDYEWQRYAGGGRR